MLESCRPQKSSCTTFFRAYFKEEKAECANAGGQRARRRCRRRERRYFDGYLASCRMAFRACRACCRGEPTACERAAKRQCHVTNKQKRVGCDDASTDWDRVSKHQYKERKLECAALAGSERAECLMAAQDEYYAARNEHLAYRRACRSAAKEHRRCCSKSENPADCIFAVCGDGVLEGAELCDDDNHDDGDGCDSNCTVTGCGNGIRTAGEDCDDGNVDSGDGCSPDCLDECGNGTVDVVEQCDDGDGYGLDGCSGGCALDQ